MTANERLAAWMVIEGLSDRDVAERLHMDPTYVFMMRKGIRAMSNGFRWSFAQAYGYEQAQKVLGDVPLKRKAHPQAAGR